MTYTPANWIEGTTVGVIADTPAHYNVLFINTATGYGLDRFPPNQWNTVDCSPVVPPDAKAVCLSTLLIITHGSQAFVADLELEVRRHGSTVQFGDYSMQTTEAYISGGQRSTAAAWVALSPDLKFDAYWRNPAGEPAWPVGSSYGINMNVNGYLR